MGEQSDKPKVEGARRTHPHNRQRRGQFTPAPPKSFSAPTSGFEKTVFTFDQADSAAKFEESRQALARYVGATYKYGGSMAQKAIQDLTAPTFSDPPALDPNADEWDRMKWKHNAEQTLKDLQTWSEVKVKVYNLLLLHCHPLLETALKGASSWKAVNAAEDPIQLLKFIRSVIHEGVGPKGEGERAVNNWIRLLCTHQRPGQDLESFYEMFQANSGAMVAAGSKPGFDYGLWQSCIKKKRAAAGISDADRTPEVMEREALEESCEEFLAILLIKLSNNSTYQPLKTHLHNKGLWDRHAWPKNQETSYGLLQNFQPEVGRVLKQTAQLENTTGLSFAELHAIDCYGCGKKGHP